MEASTVYTALLAALVFFIGACIFSFLNVIIYRVPRELNFIKGRSVCPSCGKQLRAVDLVPIFSYLFLGGSCRYCGEKIGLRDTLVEILGGGAALLCIWYYVENPLKALTVFAFFCMLTVVTFLDIDTMEIEDGCWISIFVLALISCFTMLGMPLISRIIGIFCVSLPMLAITMLIPGAFGGGDIRLMGACGAFLGWRLTLISTAIAILMGGIWGIYLLLGRKKGRKDHFAFGPFLCMGMVIGLLWGDRMINWYLGFMQF